MISAVFERRTALSSRRLFWSALNVRDSPQCLFGGGNRSQFGLSLFGLTNWMVCLAIGAGDFLNVVLGFFIIRDLIAALFDGSLAGVVSGKRQLNVAVEFLEEPFQVPD